MILCWCYFEAVACPSNILSSIKTLFFNASSLITLSFLILTMQNISDSMLNAWHSYNLQMLVLVVLCAIWYHSYILKNVEQAEAWIFNKSNTPPWVFLTFLKFYKWCQIAQSITFAHSFSWAKVDFGGLKKTNIINCLFCWNSPHI